MKKIVALVAVLFSVLVPVQSQAADTKSLVIIDSYFQSNVAQNPITSTGAACAQSKPIANAKASDPYNHGTAMYAVAKLQNPSISIIPICASSAQSDVFPSQLISSLSWVKNNKAKVKAVSISLTFNKTSLECTPFGPVNTPKARLADDVVIRSLINDLESSGIPVFAAAGNDTNKSVSYPGCIANTMAVAHADEKGNPIARYADGRYLVDANTDYFARLSLDGSKWVYNTAFGPVSQTSSSATAAVASMWVTANTPKGIVNPIS
jgi:hypothetical protein